MIDQLLARRGYGYGSGLLSPDHQRFIVNIPKNASSFLLDWTTRNGWRTALCDNQSVDELIVVLRDPVDRWISGIAQYINTYILSVHGPNGPIFPGDPITEFDFVMSADDFIHHYNQTTERLLFDVIFQFDDHVWPQVDFFQQLKPHVARTYFYIDQNFTEKISSYLNIDFVQNLDYNSSKDNVNMKKLQEFFTERLNIRPELKQRIISAYSSDYQLINRVTA
jgi:hypothetical protein